MPIFHRFWVLEALCVSRLGLESGAMMWTDVLTHVSVTLEVELGFCCCYYVPYDSLRIIKFSNCTHTYL